MRNRRSAYVVVGLLAAGPWLSRGAEAKPAFSCGGQALLGGALLVCSHVAPTAPTQSCTFSWALTTAANEVRVVSGAFLLPRGASNVQVYQGAGFVRESSPPIVLCEGSSR